MVILSIHLEFLTSVFSAGTKWIQLEFLQMYTAYKKEIPTTSLSPTQTQRKGRGKEKRIHHETSLSVSVTSQISTIFNYL